MQLKFSSLATDDLDEILDYIAQTDLRAGLGQVDAVRAVCYDVLLRNPHAGARVEGTRDMRAFVKGSYRIFYEVEDATLTVLRVVHTARDLDRIVSDMDASPPSD